MTLSSNVPRPDQKQSNDENFEPVKALEFIENGMKVVGFALVRIKPYLMMFQRSPSTNFIHPCMEDPTLKVCEQTVDTG